MGQRREDDEPLRWMKLDLLTLTETLRGLDMVSEAFMMRLLRHEWLYGPLPGSPVAAGGLVCGSPNEARAFQKRFSRLREKFRIDADGRMVNDSIEFNRKLVDSAREHGRKGAAGRWAGHARAMPEHSEENARAFSDDAGAMAGKARLGSTGTDLSKVLSTEAAGYVPLEAQPAPPARPGNPAQRHTGPNRPAWRGSRFAVFEWQMAELRNMVGPSFDVPAWLNELSERVAASNELVPVEPREQWVWVRKRTTDEAERRGLRIGATASSDDLRLERVRELIRKDGRQ
jgi:hypothetical protein